MIKALSAEYGVVLTVVRQSGAMTEWEGQQQFRKTDWAFMILTNFLKIIATTTSKSQQNESLLVR